MSNPDLAQFGSALERTARGLALRPVTVTKAGARFLSALSRVSATAGARGIGLDRSPAFEVDPRERRFADPTWTENAAFFNLRQCYLAVGQLTEDLISGAGVSAMTERKARLAAGIILDLLCPTNFVLSNPAALKRAFETGGSSVLKGAQNFVDDALHNSGRPRQVDRTAFTVGGNLAATPCQVVYRNDLMEVLQYDPQTPQVNAHPLLCSPPWINKYYIMDLAPGRSFIEWAVQQGRTVFAISYRNPDADMLDVTMDDYLIHGTRTALDVVADITGADTIDMVGLCLGGALTAITDAYLWQLGESRIGSLTLLNTMLDYSDPGVLGVFTELATIEALEEQMARSGYLDGASMSATFDALRPNDLIFNYVVANWLMGQDPPAFDILAWNADSTRMPAAMHGFYLRNFYAENKLATGDLDIAGQRIDLGTIAADVYVVSAENDHIVPWHSAYATTQLVSGPVRFVLSSGGHIAGIVNPPGPKGWYLTGDDVPSDADAWRASAQAHEGSWWEDWARWSSARAGELTDPPPMGSAAHPALGPGPGRYVMA
jgi:polyhydroxyalkanoate synthase subunit PhaC